MSEAELLGGFRIAGVDGRTWSGLGRAGSSLTGFTYPGRPHRPESIEGLFWPKLDMERSPSSLNSAAPRLRKRGRNRKFLPGLTVRSTDGSALKYGLLFHLHETHPRKNDTCLLCRAPRRANE
jgi:hypothetical protein